MKIFLDVGGHNGETLDVVLNPKYGFQVVHTFEPSENLFNILRKFRDRRLIAHKFGLGGKSEYRKLYGAGTVGGSVYSEKKFFDENCLNFVEEIKLVKVSNFILDNTTSDDLIFLKLNCEGSEADILEDLIQTNTINRIYSVYVDFDIRKIPGQEYRQELLENSMVSHNIDFTTPDKLGTKGNPAVEIWLNNSLPEVKVNLFQFLYFKFKLYLPTYFILKSIIIKLFPEKFVLILVKRFGRFSKK
jgi:FkbM family methyltransferase